MTTKEFKKGDAVPHWILNPQPREAFKSLTFYADVIVTADDTRVTVTPKAPHPPGVFPVYIDVADGWEDAPKTLQGAPTLWKLHSL